MDCEKNRRKSKIITINNICVNEDPVIIDISDTESPKSSKKTRRKSKVQTIVLSSEEDEDLKFENDKFLKCRKTRKSLNSKIESSARKSNTFQNTQKKDDNVENIPPNKNPIVVLNQLPLKDSQVQSKSQNEDLIDKKSLPNTQTPKKEKERNVAEQNSPSLQTITSENLRRSGRPRKMTLKATESFIAKKSPRKNLRDTSDDDEDDEIVPLEEIEKPTEIFEKVGGKELFGFQTPKKRGSMVQRVIDNMSSPSVNKTRTPSTPKSTGKKLQIPKTPVTVRSRVKRTVADIVRELEESDFSDFSPSSSEYEPSDIAEESDSSNNTPQSDQTPKTPEPKKLISTIPKHTPGPATRSRSTRLQKVDQNLKSDDYFSLHAKSKSLTSDHTLDILKNPKFSQDKLNDLLKTMKISREHQKGIANLTKEHKKLFNQWLFLLLEGFNVLLYGLGSKREILHDFHHEVLNQNKFPVLVVNGFFPSLVIKDIIDSIGRDLLEIDTGIVNIHEILEEIITQFNDNPQWHLFIIIHNIDGEMLRTSKTQTILSQLVSVDNIHLLASIDHINAPLIWDHSKLSKFNFTWWDTTTLLPYSTETSFEGSLLVQRSGALTLSSLKNIFKSLTTNARGIYTIIINKQIESKKDPHYQGMAFKDLYWACREAFLVSSDLALRAQLTEFLDHKLLKSKRNMDGVELLFIPIENSLLQNFLNQE